MDDRWSPGMQQDGFRRSKLATLLVRNDYRSHSHCHMDSEFGKNTREVRDFLTSMLCLILPIGISV